MTNTENGYEIKAISINTSPIVGDTDGFIGGIRVVPDGRDGKIVYARTLRPGEKDDGRGVLVNPNCNEQLRFKKGKIQVSLNDIDKLAIKYNGYAMATNTIWSWFTLKASPSVTEEQFRFFTSASRRLDTSYILVKKIHAHIKKLNTGSLTGIALRTEINELIGTAEVLVVALHRALQMIHSISVHFNISLETPETIKTKLQSVKAIRDSYEHIDERSRGLVFGKPHEDALTIFNYKRLLVEEKMVYGMYELSLSEIVELQIEAREYLIKTLQELCGEYRFVAEDITFFSA